MQGLSLKELLSSKDIKATLTQTASSAAKNAAGSALTKIMQKEGVQSLIAQQAEQKAVSTAGEQAVTFWLKYKREIIIGGAVASVGMVWILWRAFRKR